jgi:hypothetical protein
MIPAIVPDDAGLLDLSSGRVVPIAKARLPKPPTTADADLRDYSSMPVDVPALLSSRFYATTTGDEFRAGFTLWANAWLQVPAGSLPDDDRQLAVFAGYGRDVAGFQAVKAAAMMGWLPYSDGRLYHPFLTAKVNSALSTK